MPKKTWLIASAILVVLTLIPVSLRADRNILSDHVGDFGRFTETPPPAGPVRPIAEFEPASHVLIRYPLGILLSSLTTSWSARFTSVTGLMKERLLNWAW